MCILIKKTNIIALRGQCMIIELRFWYQTIFKSGYATHF